MSMEWRQLLCADRLGARKSGAPDSARPPYTIDSDRIIFCSAFRRLQDKTQVFPLADNDFVRTRLTHSLEVASVGRSLGARVGAEIVKRRGLAPDYHASDFGAIVSAAASRTISGIRRLATRERMPSSTGFCIPPSPQGSSRN